MKEPTYRQALQHGWHLAKDHKLLWLFGLFASFLGQMGLLDLVVHLKMTDNHHSLYPALSHLGENWAFLVDWVSNAGLPAATLLWIFWIALFIGGAWLMLVFASVCSQGALIHGVAQFVKSRKKNKQVDVDKAWHAGTGHFWKLLGLNILKKLAIMVPVLVVGLASMNVGVSNGAPADTALFILSLVFALVVGSLLSLMVVYAAGYIVIEDMNIHDALEAAWKLFRDHWLVSLEVAAILLLVNVVASAIAMLAMALFIGEMAIIWAGAVIFGSGLFWSIGLAFSSLLLVLFLVLIGTMLTVLTTSVWTYLFMIMHKRGIKSRVLHALKIKL